MAKDSAHENSKIIAIAPLFLAVRVIARIKPRSLVPRRVAVLASFLRGVAHLDVSAAARPGERGAIGGPMTVATKEARKVRSARSDTSNVKNLRIVWRRPAVAHEFRTQHPNQRFCNLFRSTPLMIDSVLYASNGLGLVRAFAAATGKTLWVQELLEQGGGRRRSTALPRPRGVLPYWRSGGDRRILAVRPPYLIAINLKTGELVRSFGDGGKIDLRVELGPQPQPFNFTSAPLIVKDVAIIGSSIADNPNVKEGTPGSIRGYDVKTGKLRWTFRPIPREGEFGAETWQNRSWEYTGAVNAWSNLSADEELGYVYLPLTSPTSDMYGGHRLGNNLFSDSLVCLKAETGARVWSFQMVHHDLWDYDLPAAPILADITVGGKPIKAVVQVTKRGLLSCLIASPVSRSAD